MKEDVSDILMAVYKIPGQYTIGAILAFGFWNALRDLTNWAYVLLILGIFFILLEIISPILAGARIYKRFFKKES